MNLRLSMIFRPSSAIFFLALAALIVLLSLTPCWYVMVRHIEQRVNSNSQNLLSKIQSEIRHSTERLHPMNSSSTNLARLLSSTFNQTNISFSDIQTKVAPMLFQAFETVPHLTEISYIGMEGFFFSYYRDHTQALALYSNSSFSSISGASKKVYYVQHVNPDTGGLYGEATIYEYPVNVTWIEKVVNSSYGYASLGSKWSENDNILFLSSARISKTRVISLGFSATSILDFVTHIGHQGEGLYLATKDGIVLIPGIQHTHIVFSNDMASFQSVKPINDNQFSYEGTISCKDEDSASPLKIEDTQYLASCSSIDIMGVDLVYVLAVPQDELVSFVHKSTKHALMLLIVMIVMILISIFNFVVLNAIVGRREMQLCASLIKQMEATQQAERKSMNKSLAFASASHDVRNSLAGLTCLIEKSFEEVTPGSELDISLKQMDACTKDLLGVLNSIMDTSKIEAGKMQLEEEEFDLFQLIEDVVDLFHPVAMRKRVDLVLDHCDGSVIRYSRVNGDRGKLLQVLNNLVSNAVKFTDEGHIAVRAWAQKPSFQNSMIASDRYSCMKRLSCLFYKKNGANIDQEAVNSIQQDLNYLDFVFEVDDTGKGIPKDKQNSVFENYVQVKETALGKGGTGLGLGIVQSLVRLMHGDIGIVDKDIGEKGTCFKFNVLLTVCETFTGGSSTREGNSLGGERNLSQPQVLDIHTPTSGSSICSPSPRLPIFTSSRAESSCVVLLIQGEVRRRITRRFMESLGIKVKVVKKWENLFHTLKKIKQTGRHSSQSSIGTSDMSSRSTSQNSNARAKGVPLSTVDGNDYVPSVFKKTDDGTSPGFILLVIDAIAGPFSEVGRVVSEFRRGSGNPCKVVWLNKSLIHDVKLKAVNEDVFDPDDIIMSRPFHGTRLIEVVRLLPEYGGNWPSNSRRVKRDIFHDRLKKTYGDAHPFQDVQKHEYGSSRSEQLYSHGKSKARSSPVDHGEIQECGDSSYETPLGGKKFLVAEDTEYLRRIVLKTLTQLGANTVDECKNGEQALKLVEEGLSGSFPNLPYDYILMDCEMPLMDGFEATRRIREMEKGYGVRIPIIALTAHTSGKETKMTIEAGMDVHLGKPLKKEHLLEAIRYIHSK